MNSISFLSIAPLFLAGHASVESLLSDVVRRLSFDNGEENGADDDLLTADTADALDLGDSNELRRLGYASQGQQVNPESGDSLGHSSHGQQVLPQPGGQTYCAHDTKRCWDGTIVYRNPNDNCHFCPCPQQHYSCTYMNNYECRQNADRCSWSGTPSVGACHDRTNDQCTYMSNWECNQNSYRCEWSGTPTVGACHDRGTAPKQCRYMQYNECMQNSGRCNWQGTWNVGACTDGGSTHCASGTKLCWNGMVVARDPNHNCQFMCPLA